MCILNILQILKFEDCIYKLKIKTESFNRYNLFFLELNEKEKIATFLEDNHFLFININEIEELTFLPKEEQ
ncbi:hypothetical protein COF09_31415 [Bacillus toyonensis]|uniref:hypothetical protein n=1 Tax=Bacillus toyonensis TaxID=155322 RepID=UPI000BFB58E7|nr:hypothetical protein [Bacillus toyonensis]PHC35162.1 hypothetical protein COF09_31415 [Bacillus toyonensis]